MPQGSILGPLLFLIFFNDLPSALQRIDTVLFADDTTLLTNDVNIDRVLNSCSEAQSKAEEWFAANQLCLNRGKTRVMLSSTRDLSGFGDNPDRVNFLGVVLDPWLRWDLHGDMLANKLASCAHALRLLSRSVSGDVLRVAYFGLFHSRLSYAILAWGHSASRHRLFALQRRAVRIISGAGYRDECRNLFISRGILTFPSLFALECLCYIKKNIHFYTRQGMTHGYQTRGREDLSTEFKRLTRSRTGVSFEGIKLFNLLPVSLREQSVIIFRRKLKECFLKRAFFSIQEMFNVLGTANVEFSI